MEPLAKVAGRGERRRRPRAGRILVFGCSITVAAGLVGPGPAWPAPTTTTAASTPQQHEVALLHAAMAALSRLQGQLAATTAVPAPERESLKTVLAQAGARLGSELSTVQGDSSTGPVPAEAAAVTALLDPVVHLLIPQVDLLMTAELGRSLATEMALAEPALQSLAVSKPRKGSEAALADYRTQVAGALTDLAGVPSALYALEPASYPATLPVLTSAHDDVAAAVARLGAAQTDLQVVVPSR